MPEWNPKANDIFVRAAEIDSLLDRQRFVQEQCHGDEVLCAQVESLLAARNQVGSFLNRPAIAAPDAEGTAAYRPNTERSGTIIGGYKLLEKIGEGGMGEVWVADQEQPIKRRVALKLIKPGMDSRGVLARFEAERQALAIMDHPNVAKVLDAGTTQDGRPYFVMELVKGTPITEFCDIRKLTPRERLELFVPVCQAIQHAHQKGIIHRDIKPNNVLVELYDDRAVAKVIDFGVAKAIGQRLTDKTIYTGFGALIGTPAYMAPEQATFNALDVDTRADVYALGVLLYELLAGSPPIDKERINQAALDEILRIVRDEEPMRPSKRLSTSQAKATIASTRQSEPETLSRMMKGELDWIVMKALEKDRARRYETAAAFAKDVQRYLAGDAVEACPPTLGYRLRKAYQRNRAAVWTAGAFAVVLLAGIAVSLAFAIDAESARRDAEVAGKSASLDRDAAVAAGAEKTKALDEKTKALDKLKLAQEQQVADQYVWDMQSLSSAFEANNTAEMTRLLDRHKPKAGQLDDRRGFEWFHWDRRLHSELHRQRLPGAKGGFGMRFYITPDGSHAAWIAFTPSLGPSNSFGSPIKSLGPVVLTVMNFETRKEHSHELKGVQGIATFPIVSRDGRRVAFDTTSSIDASAKDGRLKHSFQVLDVATWEVLRTLDWISSGNEFRTRNWNYARFAFSPDGKRLALRTQAPDEEGKFRDEVRVWDIDAKKDVCAPLPADELPETPFSSDGNRLVTARIQELTSKSADRVSVWDLTTGAESAGWDLPESSRLHALAYDPVGNQVAGVAGDRPAADKKTETLTAGAGPMVPEPRTLLMWSPATKKLIRELTLPQRRTDRVFNVRSYFSVDGSRLAVFRHLARSGGDSSFATVTLWDSASGNPLPIPQGLDQLTPQGISYWPAFSPDGRQVLVGEYNLVRTWDTATGKPIQSLLIQDRPAASSFSPDGQRIRSIDYNGLLKEWSAQPMNQVAIPLLRVPSNRAIAQSAAVSADGNLVFTVLRGKTDSKTDPSACVVQVWNDQGRFIRSLAAPPRAAKVPPHLHLFSLASSRDGRRVMLYREEANMQPAKFGDALAPDITVWDVDSEKVLLCQTLDMKVGQFNYASVSADGRYVATSHMSIGFALGASPVNPTVRIFDLNAEGRERPPITLPDVLNILGVEFHPDGRRVGIVAALKPDNPDAKFFVWDLENNSVQSTVELPNVGGFQAQILWSPDGKWILFGHKMHRIGPARHDLDRGPAAVIKLEIPAGEWLDERFQVWSPDGKRIAGLVTQGGGAKSTLKMWDAENGREVLRLAVPKNVTALTFRKDGRGLILASTEQLADAPRPGGAENEPNRLNLLLTTLDATPPLDREPKK